MKIRNSHYERLKGKIFKVYPFFTEKNEGLTTYISSLLYEFEGLEERLNDTQASILMTIISIFEHFYNDSIAPEPDLEVIRREWLNCLNLMDKIAELGDDYGEQF